MFLLDLSGDYKLSIHSFVLCVLFIGSRDCLWTASAWRCTTSRLWNKCSSAAYCIFFSHALRYFHSFIHPIHSFNAFRMPSLSFSLSVAKKKRTAPNSFIVHISQLIGDRATLSLNFVSRGLHLLSVLLMPGSHRQWCVCRRFVSPYPLWMLSPQSRYLRPADCNNSCATIP